MNGEDGAMAESLTVEQEQHLPSSEPGAGAAGLPVLVERILMPLASLKLTVALFAMAIFIIFAGTLAQVDRDVWDAVNSYFRTPMAWIEFQIFFPPSFFPSKPHV